MRIVSSQPNNSGVEHKTPGMVTMVGAGTGDPDLLTIKAFKALQAADVIIHDDLVSDEILGLARKEARLMLMGKRGGQRSCRQDDINRTMIVLARRGRHVVRLKSGDPMIFGRGGEEIAELRAAGIQVSVVPGITSALAMSASLGVSLTHRDHAQSVRFVTAHNRHGTLPEDLDWRSLAHPRTTTIFYMGGRQANALARRLIIEGAMPSTSVAIVSSLSRQNETRVICNLRDLAKGIIDLDTKQPILIGIGNVFSQVNAGVSFLSDHAGMRTEELPEDQFEAVS